VSSWTQVAVVRGGTWEHAANGGALTLNVTPFRIDEKVVTLEVARTVSGMENAPESSLGRPVPLLVGQSLDVLPVRVSADGATTAKYAIGTCLYNHLKNVTGTASIYTKNFADKWELVNNTLSGYFDLSASGTAGSHTLNTYEELVLSYGVGYSNLVTAVTLYCQGNGLVSSQARLKVSLYRVDFTTFNVVEEVTSGVVDLSYYNAQNAASTAEFQVTVSFDKPAFLSAYTDGAWGRYQYALGFSCTGYQAGDLSLLRTADDLSAFVRDAADSAGGFTHKYVGTLKAAKIKTQPIIQTFTDHVASYTSAGLTYTKLEISQVTPDTGQSAPPFDSLPVMIGGVQGLSSYAGGVVYNKPNELGLYLSYAWSGSAWTDPSTFDATTLSAHYAALYNGTSYRSRVAKGVFEARSTVAQVLQEVARGTASRVGALSTGKLFFYPWGYTASPAAVIPAADIIPLSWGQRDLSTVVNQAVVSVGRSPRYAGQDFEDPTQVDGYQYTTDFSAGNFPQVEFLTAESRAMYGSRPLASGLFPVWPVAAGSGSAVYLGGSTSEGSVLAEFFFTRYAKPLVYASFIVPWHRYSALKQFDVVSFMHPEFPAYQGTDPSPPQPVVDTGSSVERVEPNGGYEWVRAEPYRGLVEGISTVLAMEHAPAIRLTVLVLLNHPYDPT
jgi:hypothetical protein